MADRGTLDHFQPWRGEARATAESVVSNVTTLQAAGGECTYKAVNGAGTAV